VTPDLIQRNLCIFSPGKNKSYDDASKQAVLSTRSCFFFQNPSTSKLTNINNTISNFLLPPATGLFMEPTVFTEVEDHMFIAEEESFGPIMIISKFQDGYVLKVFRCSYHYLIIIVHVFVIYSHTIFAS